MYPGKNTRTIENANAVPLTHSAENRHSRRATRADCLNLRHHLPIFESNENIHAVTH